MSTVDSRFCVESLGEGLKRIARISYFSPFDRETNETECFCIDVPMLEYESARTRLEKCGECSISSREYHLKMRRDSKIDVSFTGGGFNILFSLDSLPEIPEE